MRYKNNFPSKKKRQNNRQNISFIFSRPDDLQRNYILENFVIYNKKPRTQVNGTEMKK